MAIDPRSQLDNVYDGDGNIVCPSCGDTVLPGGADFAYKAVGPVGLAVLDRHAATCEDLRRDCE